MDALAAAALLALLALAAPAGAVKFKVYRGTAECISEDVGRFVDARERGGRTHGRAKVEGEFLVRGANGGTDRKAKVDWSLLGPGHVVMGSGQAVLQDSFHVDVQAALDGEWTMCFALSKAASAASATLDLSQFQISLPGLMPGVLGHVDAEGAGEAGAPAAGTDAEKLEGAATASHAKTLEAQAGRLRWVIQDIRLQQRKLSQRDSRHLATIKSTKSRSEAAAVVECLVSVAMTAAQVLVVRSFFATNFQKAKGRCV